jgi:16S rRNA (adenine1518-N6/adenine1519-N6)-dimethyltransferase
MFVRPKKSLGQHFLTNQFIAKNIVDTLQVSDGDCVLEIGPGTGVLTKFLIEKKLDLTVIELDRDSVEYLKNNLDVSKFKIVEGDFIKLPLSEMFERSFSIIGNFPYNISSQIFFKVLENRNTIDQVVCMIQKEVAQRIAAPPGSKTYGILSVLLQAFYTIEYVITVKPGAFHPPPKVDSGVIRLKRNEVPQLDCDERLFTRVVKQGFQNRRKTLRNALKPINLPVQLNTDPVLDLRAEALGVEEFVSLTNKISEGWSK